MWVLRVFHLGGIWVFRGLRCVSGAGAFGSCFFGCFKALVGARFQSSLGCWIVVFGVGILGFEWGACCAAGEMS